MDDDLIHILLYIRRKTTLADDPLTRAYLESGIRLLEAKLFAEPAGNDQSESRTFRWISRANIIAEVDHGPQHLPRQGRQGTFRDRWEPFSDYLGDLVVYVLRDRQWDDRIGLAKQAKDALPGGKLSKVVHEVTYRDLRVLSTTPAMRFLFFFTVFADRDPILGGAISRFYRENTKAWGAVYAAFFQRHGLRLRRDCRWKTSRSCSVPSPTVLR